MKKNKSTDFFAEIAGQQITNTNQLIIPGPQQVKKITLPAVNDPTVRIPDSKSRQDIQWLQNELSRMRKKFQPFLDRHAPVPEERKRLPVTQCSWRIETDEDMKDFPGVLAGKGSWEKVTIPHFGPPLGRAATLYRTTITLEKQHCPEDQRTTLFICFKGVDYKAQVYVNGALAGTHEGFFAPFEFNVSRMVREGKNHVLVRVENDAVCMGNNSWGKDGYLYEGDKIYAATGPGYDDPQIGWHHCPPGMGIYQDFYFEVRPALFIQDIFIRPLEDLKSFEAWIEINNTGLLKKKLNLGLSLHGRNFKKTVFRHKQFGTYADAGPGVNQYKISFSVSSARVWSPDTPWLYELSVHLKDENNKEIETRNRHFGVRFFHMNTTDLPRGNFELNGRRLRLFGANTMGFEQQDVMKKNFPQLIDDILLAKISNLNFWRLTQRPVQDEIYTYCDCLGLMVQTDLPAFAVLRRNQYAEAVRQAGEMERLVRAHPSNIAVSFINEPSTTWTKRYHRFLDKNEMLSFFESAASQVLLENPDRVIKPVDGDYEPPSPSLPDVHCYCLWYNGHGLDFGKLHAGHWQAVKPGWNYGCGEYGAEGLEDESLMRERYPADWLPESAAEAGRTDTHIMRNIAGTLNNTSDEKKWTPNFIIRAQTGNFHYMWFPTPHTLKDWIAQSQKHQAWSIKVMTEAFRRDNRMVSFAVHLFIDAFPSGWMKAVMDCRRVPKPAYFSLRESLSPVIISLRSDRTAYFSFEKFTCEVWAVNDSQHVYQNAEIRLQILYNREILFSVKSKTNIPVCKSICAGVLTFPLLKVKVRTNLHLKAALCTDKGKVLNLNTHEFTVFPKLNPITAPAASPASAVIFIPSYGEYLKKKKSIHKHVSMGGRAVFGMLPENNYVIAGHTVQIMKFSMNDRLFVSCDTGHALVEDFLPDDFKLFFNDEKKRIAPFTGTFICASRLISILTSGEARSHFNRNDTDTSYVPVPVAAELKHGAGSFVFCQIDLKRIIRHNPVARIFYDRLFT